jgi:hypothetical protein
VIYETEHAAGVSTAGEPPDADVQELGQELAVFLEPDQLLVGQEQQIPRAALGPRARAALWVLRVFVIAVSAMVVYAFVAQLGS